MHFNKTRIGAKRLVILGLVSGLRGFADWPMFGHDPQQTNWQLEGLGCMDTAPYVKWIWANPYGKNAECPPVTGDLDGDGANEIVATFRGDSMLYAFKGENGSYLWTRKMPSWIPGWHSPAVGDIDGDGLQEIVLNIAANPALYALNGEDGSTLWTFPVGEELLLIDSDNDGDLEVLTRVSIGGPTAQTYLLDGLTGEVLWVVSDTPSSVGLAGPLELTFASGDLNGDGVLEVVNLTVMGEYESIPSIHIYDARDGTLLFKGVRYLDPPMGWYVPASSPLLYDIDGDGNLEILVENWGVTRL